MKAQLSVALSIFVLAVLLVIVIAAGGLGMRPSPTPMNGVAGPAVGIPAHSNHAESCGPTPCGPGGAPTDIASNAPSGTPGSQK